MSTTGLYTDDSDADSHSAEPSRADGYFSQRARPQEPYTDTPSSSSDSSKAREAMEDSQSSSVAHVSSPRETATSSAWSDEGTPLLAAGPPPAYWTGNANTSSGPSVGGDGRRGETDSPTRSLDEHEHEQSSSGYGTTLLTPASTPFTRSNAPQSMRSFQKFDDPVGGMWARDNWRARARRCVQPSRTLQLFLGIMGILGLVWILKVARPNHEAGNTPLPGTPQSSRCPPSAYTEATIFEFDNPEDFKILEHVEYTSHIRGGIWGIIRITPGQADQKARIQVNMSVTTTELYLSSQLEYAKSDSSLRIKTPLERRSLGFGSGFGFSAHRPCMDIFATVSIAPGVELRNFYISTANLRVRIDAGLDLTVTNRTAISGVASDISCEVYDSRETVIDVISGSVSGTYALRDLLSIRTTSGSISVNVDPREVDSHRPAPAVFHASSSSGGIEARFPVSGSIPDRDYRVTVAALSGPVRGAYLHGRSTTLTSASGSIEVEVVPYHADAYPSTMRTETIAGRTELVLRRAYSDPATAIGRLHSVHKAASGGVQLSYPQQWTGRIEAQSMSGAIRLRGKDVEIVRRSEVEGMVVGRVVARKGRGHGLLEVETMSGSVDATVGDL